MTSTETSPQIGQIVHYVSKIDNGPGNDVFSPAMVIRTRATTVPAVIDRWTDEPRTVTSASDPDVTHQTTGRPADLVAELPDDTTVDLLVHGLGGDYREYAVAEGTGPGTWHWPEEVPSVPDPARGWWRQGRKQSRNLYRHLHPGDESGEFVGVMFSGEVAEAICKAMNARL